MLKIFDYACTNKECRHVFEKATKPPHEFPRCPKCDSETDKRLSMPAFTLKGQGFYSTGTYSKSKDGPKLDQDLLKLSDRDLNRELGLPENCA